MGLPNVQPEHYDAQLRDKLDWVKTEFAEFNLPQIEVFESEREHYRLRAEFRVWHDGDDLYYVMFDGDKHTPVRIDSCPMVSERIHQMMFKLLDVIRPNEILRRRLFQIDFLSTLSGELTVSLLYHRPIGEEWAEEARKLRGMFDIDIIGRARKTKILLDRDFVIETLNINGKEFQIKQVENSFSQPNGKVCEQMIQWGLDATKEAGGDLVEYYCGAGTFTLPLAQNFRRVVATELAKVSVHAAKDNIALNGIDNVDVVRISAEDFSQVLQGKLQTRRVNGLALEECDFTTVLVDPPRAGLDDDTVQQVLQYDNILYISCNPETLKSNLQAICQSHQVERFALFDQFPYTHHMECGVFLTRKPS
ncbi:tRNA (uridine(54)-C5)-methyltransferase TrmA [Marinobacterium arenosum]|uniref:tRNA (uridine(54)-C5)-methyltransferase TrmA n=1 Tax=Marinobacterium arenosum TaxID=2862496 RepID=UPI001C96E48A|nr:tRNA (uridine(54)-C5)-methyltransferase TrmA [Marinobacterium arenosum]MBY4676980.1 tRNA (uridine(54)-C5)-methyltransferase TrmA [Marinobacterium arenosum]